MRIVHGFESHPRRALLPGLRQTVDIEPLDTVEPWREQGTWRQLGTRFGCRMAEHHAAAAPPPTVQLRLGIGQLALGAGVRQSSRSLQRMWDERVRTAGCRKTFVVDAGHPQRIETQADRKSTRLKLQ